MEAWLMALHMGEKAALADPHDKEEETCIIIFGLLVLRSRYRS
jgi:hypothetical protein